MLGTCTHHHRSQCIPSGESKRVAENEFEGTSGVKSCRALVVAVGFILNMMEANGGLKTRICNLIYNFKLFFLAAVGE